MIIDFFVIRLVRHNFIEVGSLLSVLSASRRLRLWPPETVASAK